VLAIDDLVWCDRRVGVLDPKMELWCDKRVKPVWITGNGGMCAPKIPTYLSASAGIKVRGMPAGLLSRTADPASRQRASSVSGLRYRPLVPQRQGSPRTLQPKPAAAEPRNIKYLKPYNLSRSPASRNRIAKCIRWRQSLRIATTRRLFYLTSSFCLLRP
jgi:hypothetical protein